jgi:carboxylesterase type B
MLETPSGPIKGIKEIYAETGEPFYEFRGIPFGKPPIGPLRFKKSIPFGTWKDTLDATAYGAACPQNIPESLGFYYGLHSEILRVEIVLY